jgi:hypothetical protein
MITFLLLLKAATSPYPFAYVSEARMKENVNEWRVLFRSTLKASLVNVSIVIASDNICSSQKSVISLLLWEKEKDTTTTRTNCLD